MRFDDASLEKIMGRLLRTGVIAAAAVMVAGGIFYITQYAQAVPDYAHFHGVRDNRGTGQRILRIGILLTIATPVMRVVFAVVAFAIERDWLYTVISSVVLGVLCFALFR
jgi:uncharacterized membrane protein